MKPLKSKLLDGEMPRPIEALPPIKVSAATSDVSNVPPTAPATRPIKVMVSIPSGRSWEARTATAITGLSAFSALQGISVGVINLEGSMITKQRNDLVDAAKKHNADYILFVDSDMVFPPDALVRLLKHDRDIVGATYNKRVPPYETLGHLIGERPTDEQLRAGGLIQADLMPGGFMLVKMAVYEKLRWPWYYETYQWPGADGVEAFKNFVRDNYGAAPSDEILASIEGTPLAKWLNEVHEIESKTQWRYYSEDLSFCRKAIKAGLEMWCDMGLTYQMVHLGTIEVTCKSPPAPGSDSVVVPAIM